MEEYVNYNKLTLLNFVAVTFEVQNMFFFPLFHYKVCVITTKISQFDPFST